MPKPIGLSFLFPLAPIMSLLSAVLLAMLIPGFWKTRVVSLIAMVGWLIIRNLLLLIGTVQWRGNVEDCPIWADILAALRYIQAIGLFLSMACFAKFVWQRLQPSARGFYDTRRRQNRIDVFLTLLLPLMWTPTGLLVYDNRYIVVEDLGVLPALPLSLSALLFVSLPVALCAATIIIFNLMALVTYWRFRKDTTTPAFANRSASVRTRKLVLFSLMNMFLAMFAIYTMGSPFLDWPNSHWDFPTFAEIQGRLKVAKFLSRADMDAFPRFSRVYIIQSISIFTLGFYIFAWFGFSEEAIKPCRKAFEQLLRLTSITTSVHAPTFTKQRSRSWTRWFRKFEPPQEPDGPVARPGTLSRTGSPTSEDIEPFFELWSPEISVADSSDKNHARRGRNPQFDNLPRRLSFHKPSLSLTPTSNQSSSGETSIYTPLRRISCHKPALPANYLDTPILPALLPESLEPCRLSHQKPSLPPAYTPSSESGPFSHMAPCRPSSHKPSPPMIGDASTPGVNASNSSVSRRISFHKPPLPTSHVNSRTFGVNATDRAKFDLLPIQLFLPPVQQTHSDPNDLQMMPFSSNNNSH